MRQRKDQARQGALFPPPERPKTPPRVPGRWPPFEDWTEDAMTPRPGFVVPAWLHIPLADD